MRAAVRKGRAVNFSQPGLALLPPRVATCGMRGLFLILLLVGLTAPAAAQYKGRLIGGAPVAFDGDTLLVKPEGAPAIRIVEIAAT